MILNPHISVDCVVFGFDYKYLKALLVEREIVVSNSNQKQIDYKLPGALIANDEELDDAAYRVLNELTQLHDIYLKKFDVFGSKSRMQNPEDIAWLREYTGLQIDRVITVAYYSLIKLNDSITNPTISPNSQWINVEMVPTLPFDHNLILNGALSTLRNELRTKPIGFELLPNKFSIRQVQNLYEVILGIKLDNRNFRKRFHKLDYIIQLDEKEENVNHKPALLYQFDKSIYEKYQNKTLEFLL